MKEPTLADIEAMAAETFARLPDHFRLMCDDIVIEVTDFADNEVLKSVRIQNKFDLLGLFQGVGVPFQSATTPQVLPNRIWLYRRPILKYWAEHDDSLSAIVTHVLVHEIGHHFGLSDEDIAAIEKAGD